MASALATGAGTASGYFRPIDSPETSFPSTLSVEPFLILLGLGFVIGGLGHLFGLRLLVAVGVLLVVTATLVGPAVVVLLMR